MVGYVILGGSLLWLSTLDIDTMRSIKQFDTAGFLWCLAFSFLGFGVLAFHLRDHTPSPWPSYLTYYPPVLAASAALVYSACYFSEVTRGMTFYPLSAALCFIMAQLSDDFYALFSALIRKRIS